MAAAREPKQAATGTDTVVIGCRHPLGFILRVHDKIERSEPVLGGGFRMEPQFRPTGHAITIYGTAREPGKDAKTMIRNGAALTFGIPKDFWERYKEENKGSPILENGILFEESSEARAADKAKEFKNMRHGLEPLKGSDDPRIPKSTNPAVSNIEARVDED